MEYRFIKVILILLISTVGTGCGIDASIEDLNPQLETPSVVVLKGEISTANGARGVGSSFSVSGDGKYHVRSAISSMSSRVSTRSSKYSVTFR